MRIPGFTAENSLGTTFGSYGEDPQIHAALFGLSPQLRAGGGGGSSDHCVDEYQNCYIDCSVKHPESNDSPNNLNAEYRQGCFDSCDAAYRLCSPARVRDRTGRSIGPLAYTAPRIAG